MVGLILPEVSRTSLASHEAARGLWALEWSSGEGVQSGVIGRVYGVLAGSG